MMFYTCYHIRSKLISNQLDYTYHLTIRDKYMLSFNAMKGKKPRGEISLLKEYITYNSSSTNIHHGPSATAFIITIMMSFTPDFFFIITTMVKLNSKSGDVSQK